jgi:hypothetical protein
MAQKYIVGDVVMYDNKIMVIKEPRDGSHFDLSCPKEGLVYCLVDIDEIKPVSLTPETLEKNGWKKEVMNRGVKNSHWVYTKPDIEEYGYFPIYIEKGIGDEFDVYPFTDNNVCKQIAYIKYVHQLQHLLFGLGINHEMEV